MIKIAIMMILFVWSITLKQKYAVFAFNYISMKKELLDVRDKLHVKQEIHKTYAPNVLVDIN